MSVFDNVCSKPFEATNFEINTSESVCGSKCDRIEYVGWRLCMTVGRWQWCRQTEQRKNMGGIDWVWKEIAHYLWDAR
jgi:hypothetical protein